MADKKQAVVTALRGLAHSFGELSKAHRTAQSAIHEYSVEIEHSDAPQNLLQNFPALFGNLESVGTSKAKVVATASKASPAVEGEDVDVDDKKRKRGPNKEKKVKDPNAPKRPASAYIEYQNSVREDFRNRYSELPYAEVLKKIGESWAELSDDAKKPYHEIMETKKTTYLADKKAYEAEHGPPQTIPAGTADAEAKEYTGKKRGRKSNAERALIAAAAATTAGGGGVVAEPSSSKQQADIPVDAPSKKTVEESDEESDDSDDSEDSSSEDESEEESEEEPTPPPAPVVIKKEKKAKNGAAAASADKHKSKKQKA